MIGGPSVGHLMVSGRSPIQVIAALDKHLRFWDFHRHSGSKEELRALRPTESRQYMVSSAGDWTVAAAEHLPDLFELGFTLSKTWPGTPIIVSRAFSYGVWECKAYVDRDLVFKVGDDPDHELPWVGRPLDDESIPRAEGLLGGADWRGFLQAVVARRASPNDLMMATGVDITGGFAAGRDGSGEQYAAWFRR